MKVLFRMIVFACLSVGMTSAPSYADESSAVHSEKKIAAVSKAVKKLIQKKSIAGAVTMVSWKGEIIHLDAQGMRDIKDQAPLQTDTLFRIFSMTKPVTSVAVMILVERGDIRLDEPAETYLPELKGLKVHRKGKPKRKMTVRHLLTHTAGLTYGFFSNTPVDKMYNRNHPLYSASNTQMMEKLTQHPLLFQPGKKWHYSVSTDVLGALVERVSGESLGAFFEANIFRPLEMSDTSFYVSSDKIKRFSSS
ncbi:MAG: serine hydrolase domain-containing protein, partial [Myxococcota bacterium]|nr:serine hydrolase domain-containing protein [Myxococcota bacterium]